MFESFFMYVGSAFIFVFGLFLTVLLIQSIRQNRKKSKRRH